MQKKASQFSLVFTWRSARFILQITPYLFFAQFMLKYDAKKHIGNNE